MKKIILFFILFFVCFNVNAEEQIVYLNLTKSGSIVIINNEIRLNNSSSITIEDFQTYQSAFLTGDDSKYPLYIIDNNGTYTFSNSKKDGKNIYILSTKIFSVVTTSASTNISSCEALFGYQFINLLKDNVFKLIYMLIPIILLVTSSMDFFKLVFSDDKDGLSGAFQKFTKRIVVSVFLFLVPTILIFLINLLGSDEIKTCVETFQTTENVIN